MRWGGESRSISKIGINFFRRALIRSPPHWGYFIKPDRKCRGSIFGF
jgi:hypothetical protein